MTSIATVATLRAVETGRAQPRTAVRHTHVAPDPLVFIPLQLAGEACAPLALMCGTARDQPHTLIVPQPRNRDQRFLFASQLAEIVLPFIEGHCLDSETYETGRSGDRQTRDRFMDAPQIIVPNPGGVSFTRLFGRSTRLRRTTGPHAVPPGVPLLGRWLTWFADQAEFPGSSVLLAMTDVLAAHWATGQSAVEDGNLAALLAWIDPPEGMSGAQAALLAENPATHPPAGPTTDPFFDSTLIELIDAYESAQGDARRTAAHRRLQAELHTQLAPTWETMWRALDLLRALPAGTHAADRWAGDRIRFTEQVQFIAQGGAPQPRRDHAVGAARRLDRLESAAARCAVQQAFDDPLVMAQFELTGEAISGVVLAAEPQRVIGRSRRPLITLRVERHPQSLADTALTSPSRVAQEARIIRIRQADRGFELDIELTKGMGRGIKGPPPEGSVPEVGEELCYTSLTLASFAAPLPDEAQTPWTHGGPPQAYQSTDEDAEEEWQ